jgi:hypothetical protein
MYSLYLAQTGRKIAHMLPPKGARNGRKKRLTGHSKGVQTAVIHRRNYGGKEFLLMFNKAHKRHYILY